MDPKTYKFDTLSLHAGYQPEKNRGSRQVPIYQTTSYLFDDVDHAAALFNLERGGHIYSRISNPTVGVLEERVAALEGGTAAIATSSGMAAIFLAIMTLCESGDHIVASSQVYGGTANLLRLTLPKFGINTTFVKPRDTEGFQKAIKDTRLSLLMFLSSYLLCIHAFVDAVFDGMRVPTSAGAAFCCTLTWGSYIGAALILATLMVKLLRVYRVFTLFGKTGKLYSDAGLMVMILLLVSGMVVILTIWTAVDTYHVDEIETFNSKTTPPRYDIVQRCHSTYGTIWISASALYIISVLYVPLLLLAFKTRMVWRRDFKDTKKVTALVFTLALLMSLGVPLWFLLEQDQLRNLTVIVSYTIDSVLIQLFLFVPKVVPPLVRRFQPKVKS